MLNRTQWHWRLYQWQRRFENWKAGLAAGRQPSGVKQFKFCAKCGAMLERDDAACIRCGARAPRWFAWRIQRMLGLIMPTWGAASGILVAANIVNFAAVAAIYGFRAILSPPGGALLEMGALVPPLVLQGGEWWRVITYGYLHIGLMHIGFNMFALTQVGPVLEDQVGSARFFVLYTLALIGGAAADLLLRGRLHLLIAGASGALFGLIGFGMSYGHFSGGYGGRVQRDFFLRWALYGFVFGFLIGADNIAHMGGFVTGAALGFVIERERSLRVRLDPVWAAAAWILAAATAGAFAWMVVAKI